VFFRVILWSGFNNRFGGIPMKNKLIAIAVLIFTLSAFAYSQKNLKSNWAEFEKNKVHYYDIGSSKSKKALVFIHGWTCSADFWKENYNAFSGYRVIALDLIGHGQSDKPNAAYTMEYFAKSIEAVLKKAKVKKAVLVGHSMGTPVARQFYRLYPDQTLGIVIVDGGLRPFAPKEVMNHFVEGMRANYKQSSSRMVAGMITTIKDEALKKFIVDGMGATPEAVALSAMEGMGDEKNWGDDKINVPVLAILAQGPWPADTEAFLRSLAPSLEYSMWTGVGHFLMMEKPKEFNEAVKAFIVKNKLL
jgi:pimeloyl-ACP methyl ester carboxylesterase